MLVCERVVISQYPEKREVLCKHRVDSQAVHICTLIAGTLIIRNVLSFGLRWTTWQKPGASSPLNVLDSTQFIVFRTSKRVI
jgi:hypothetical protein